MKKVMIGIIILAMGVWCGVLMLYNPAEGLSYIDPFAIPAEGEASTAEALPEPVDEEGVTEAPSEDTIIDETGVPTDDGSISEPVVLGSGGKIVGLDILPEAFFDALEEASSITDAMLAVEEDGLMFEFVRGGVKGLVINTCDPTSNVDCGSLIVGETGEESEPLTVLYVEGAPNSDGIPMRAYPEEELKEILSASYPNGVEIITLTEPTQEELEEAVSELEASGDGDDSLLIFINAHGSTDNTITMSEDYEPSTDEILDYVEDLSDDYHVALLANSCWVGDELCGESEPELDPISEEAPPAP